MPNVFKAFSRGRSAETYKFPEAEDILVGGEPEPAEELEPESQAEPEAGNEQAEQEQGAQPEGEAAEGGQAEAGPAKTEPEGPNPVTYAQIQAEKILEEARAEAEKIKKKAQGDAEANAKKAYSAAREEGFREGYADGMTQAVQEGRLHSEEQAALLEEQVNDFLEKAGRELDKHLDSFVPDLRDLAMAVAEKVICVSLKSSADVISRMIQTAIDKRKRREWAHIYIAECDAKRLTQMPASLTTALTALSDRVRIIPMTDDESGTCIIEMPDEIIDASAATQMNNLRTILMDTANSAAGFDLLLR